MKHLSIIKDQLNVSHESGVRAEVVLSALNLMKKQPSLEPVAAMTFAMSDQIDQGNASVKK